MSSSYQPALDGVRALAVIAVVLFHAQVPGFDGGYLGVSVFFTLSGYLITGLLLAEHGHTGRIDLPRFYGRRMRRLLPASTACLVAIVVLGAIGGFFDGVADLRRQVVGAALQVANWVLLAGEGSYQDLFQDVGGARSPLEHYWSLAIEQQFYWLWPPVMILVLGAARTSRSRIVAVGAITAVFALAAPVIAAVWGPDAAYWSTPARMAEILIGALLAMLLARGQVGARVAALAGAALLVLAAGVVLFPASSGPAYEGWLPVVALVSAALILGLQVDSPVRRALSLGPLVWIGGLSYGIYLYHWPIFVIADADRLGIDGAPLLVIQLAITLILSNVSLSLLEQPIRRSRTLSDTGTLAAGAAVTAAAVLAAVVVVPAEGNYWEVDAATSAAAAIDVTGQPLEQLVTPGDAPAEVEPSGAVAAVAAPATIAPAADAVPTPSTTMPLPDLVRPVRIVVAGDSTADATGAGLVKWAAENPDLAQVEVFGAPGCGFLRDGERLISGNWEEVAPLCDPWLDQIPGLIGELQPDVIVLMSTSWDLITRRWTGEMRTPLDPEYADRLAADYRRITDEMLETGAHVVWIRPPIPNIDWRDRGTDQEDPERHAVVAAIWDDLAEARPGLVSIIELDTWLTAAGLDDDRSIRPDGVHWDPDAALRIADDFLGDSIIRRTVIASAGS